MRITFPGPDGQPITVADTRPQTGRGKQASSIVAPTQLRPSSFIVSSMRVARS